MKKVLFLIPITLLVFAFSCNKDEDKTTLLTVAVEENAVGPNEEKWIIISDRAGNYLDQKQCFNGQTLSLTSDKVLSTIDMTVFSYNTGSLSVSYLSTLLGIASNQALTLTNASSSRPSPGSEGKVSFEIINYDEPQAPEENLSFVNGWDNPGFSYLSFESSGSTFVAEIRLYSGLNEILITGFRNGERVYHLEKDMEDGINITLDWADFQPYSEIFEIPAGFNQESYTVGNRNDFSYLLSRNHNDLLQETYTNVGYVEGYESYLTKYSGVAGSTLVTYFKRGEKAGNIDFPTFSKSMASTSIGNLMFETSVDYTYKSAQWLYSDNDQAGVSWVVFGSKQANLAIKGIPSEVSKRYPNMKLQDFNLFDFTLTQRLDDFSYEDLASNFMGNVTKEDFEYILYTGYQ